MIFNAEKSSDVLLWAVETNTRTPRPCQSPVSRVSSHWQAEPSPLSEGCLLNDADLFSSGQVSFLPRKAKRGDQFSGEGWAACWAAKVAFWAQRTVVPVCYIISLWGWACCNNDLLTLQLISMQRHSGFATLSPWILKQKRCEWEFSEHECVNVKLQNETLTTVTVQNEPVWCHVSVCICLFLLFKWTSPLM